MRNRRFAVLLGFLFSTVFVAGVAGAEPESGPSARATVGGDGPEANSVSGEQYADAGANDGGSGDDAGSGGDNAGGEDRASEETRPPQDGEEGSEQAPPSSVATASAGSRAEAGGGTRQDARTSRTILIQRGESRQSESHRVSRQERARQSSPEDRGQRQQSGVSRESNGSGEPAGASASASRAEARAAARTIQSPEIRTRVRELREKERAGDLGPAATGEGRERRSQELRIAREEIVSQPVDEASLKRYKRLYEEAAEEYGFGDDWYVLAAVGEVESDHGQNMGPSSAGAMGPMQFMPSTWDSYGLDANDDGKANIMDPEDAIPSAARYLKAGGAPDDWYEALYTYNHAGWYVEKVLKVAEGYRQAAGDDEVGPYYSDR